MFSSRQTAGSAPTSPAQKAEGSENTSGGWRETVESIVVAVILAFLFRAFIAEAFVIPTGSMAPTLQGRHMDVRCQQCGYRYRTGASSENSDSAEYREVTHTTCPLCRYTMELQKATDPNHRSFNGDRILVSKYAYLLAEPKRYDVIVFKYPGNAKQNYIKRLIGLPGESLRIRHGDIFTCLRGGSRGEGAEQKYTIARKPPDKVRAMLQVVHDTDYVAEKLQSVGWPSRWQTTPADRGGAAWQPAADGAGFEVEAGQTNAWLRYRHIVPRASDWLAIEGGTLPERLRGFEGQLVTDYYEYNDYYPPRQWEYGYDFLEPEGTCWVGDLALECELEVRSEEGEILLDLVEGGTHYTCRIPVATGTAELSIHQGAGEFVGADGRRLKKVQGETSVRGQGRYRLRFANVDDQLLLWVNNRLVKFAGPTTYEPPDNVAPRWSPEDPGDLAPAGVGSSQASLRVTRLRILRDVYYLAVEADDRFKQSEYEGYAPQQIQQVMTDPRQWATTSLFASRRSVEFELGADEFFPLGDNSPQSKDARLWSLGSRATGYRDPPPYVDRSLLIGKALLIYWPHAWRGPFALPLLPNFARMGLIR